MAEWYYQGRYGQIGPITEDQLAELIQIGGIDRATYVWAEPMEDWQPASSIPSLKAQFPSGPPAPPAPPAPPSFDQTAAARPQSVVGNNYYPDQTVRSDKSRIIAAVLSLVPGFGRFYLGYYLIGILQLVLFPFGIGIIWSWLDALLIFFGNLKVDAQGLRLT